MKKLILLMGLVASLALCDRVAHAGNVTIRDEDNVITDRGEIESVSRWVGRAYTGGSEHDFHSR